LLDDIYTTGATVQAATAVFRRAGIPVVGCVIVARATLRRPGATKAVG
jgi:predicted amidophosphoribosyltransferase